MRARAQEVGARTRRSRDRSTRRGGRAPAHRSRAAGTAAGTTATRTCSGRSCFRTSRSRRSFSLRSRTVGDEPAVKTSASYLASHCLDERSGLSLALASIALGVHGRDNSSVADRAGRHMAYHTVPGERGHHRRWRCTPRPGTQSTMPPSDCSSRLADLTRRDFLASAAAAVVAAGAACRRHRPWNQAIPAPARDIRRAAARRRQLRGEIWPTRSTCGARAGSRCEG